MTASEPKAPDSVSADADSTKRVGWTRGTVLFRRFFRWLAPDLRLGAAILFLMLLAVPAGVISPALLKRVFDEALENRDVDLLVELSAWIFAITLAAHGLRLWSAQLGATLKSRVRERIARQLFEHVLRLPLKYFRGHETGYVMARVRDDVIALDVLMTDTIAHSAVDAGRAVLFFALLLFTDFGLALAGLGLISLIAIGVVLFSKPLRRRSAAAQEADAELNATLHQSLTGIFTVRVSAQENTENTRFAGSLGSAVRAILARDRLHVNIAYTIGLAFALGTYAILTVGAFRMLEGTTTLGSLLQFSIYLTYVAGAVTPLMGLNPAIQHALVALQRIYAMLDSPSEHDTTRSDRDTVRSDRDTVRSERDPAGARTRLDGSRIRGAVRFEGVGYRYDETWALRGVTVDVAPGESIALVGRSGAGKSTFVHLIPRLADPTEGSIAIDGVDLRDYDLRSLRARIGFVPQDVFLFNRSIRENISYGRQDATDAQIRAAAIAAHADEFITKLEKGYDAIVGERGVRLSGGERQRIAIAREILRDPPILVLDEATSSLDSESERLIRDAIEHLKRDRTCFIIAHRLSTVMSCDRILVLDAGRIVESGSHRTLLDSAGMYSRLHRASGLIDAP